MENSTIKEFIKANKEFIEEVNDLMKKINLNEFKLNIPTIDSLKQREISDNKVCTNKDEEIVKKLKDEWEKLKFELLKKAEKDPHFKMHLLKIFNNESKRR